MSTRSRTPVKKAASPIPPVPVVLPEVDSAPLATPAEPEPAQPEPEAEPAAELEVALTPLSVVLEAPEVPEAPLPDADYVKIADSGVASALMAPVESIVDEATGLSPDPDTVFEQVSPDSGMHVCTVRLIMRTVVPMFDDLVDIREQLLLHRGAQVSSAQAAAIIARLRDSLVGQIVAGD